MDEAVEDRKEFANARLDRNFGWFAECGKVSIVC